MLGPSLSVRLVHTKNNDNKYIVLKMYLNNKEKQSPHCSYNNKGTEKQYRLNAPVAQWLSIVLAAQKVVG